MSPSTRTALSALVALAVGTGAVRAAQVGASPVQDRATAESCAFQRHVQILASPALEGRKLGTRGLECALGYIEEHFRGAGLVAPFPQGGDVTAPEVGIKDATVAVPTGSYRQRFDLGTRATIRGGQLALLEGDEAFVHGAEGDFVATAFGAAGEVRGPLVCVGYAIDTGPHGEREFSSFPSGLRLDGKIALALRFEPMDETGRSRWDPARTWSSRAQLDQKFTALKKLGASAVLLVNPPGAYYPREESLLDPRTSSRGSFDFPILHLTSAAGERLVAALDPGGRTLLELRQLADVGPLAVELGRGVSLKADLVKERLFAENVVGLLPGRGALAAECVVVGAHVDHSASSDRGSARGSAQAGDALLLGADDNASGAAGLLVLAERLALEDQAALAGGSRRAFVFVAFSGAGAGLRGSKDFVLKPPVPVAQMALMLNVERLGRLGGGRLHFDGVASGRGLASLVAPCVAASPLEVVQTSRVTVAGAHTPFSMARVPALFVYGDPHDDLRTPRDTADRIDAASAVQAVHLLYAVALAAATSVERCEFAGDGR
jgi:hypothetical protein